jgi:membrane-bound ClpP family serine protease
MKSTKIAILFLVFVAGLLLVFGQLNAIGKSKDKATRPLVYRLDVDGTINPATAGLHQERH